MNRDHESLAGIPAFPSQELATDALGELKATDHYPGLTVREHFASLALQGLAACGDYWSRNPREAAARAVALADALIEELQATEGVLADEEAPW